MAMNTRRNIALEEKAQMAIERRRRAEEERRIIILDPHKRQFGIDKDAIEAQKTEKQRAKEMEKKRDEDFHRLMTEQQRQLELQEEERKDFRRRQLGHVMTYRQLNQSATTRREYDLNDPDQLKKSLPARVSDDDPRLGPSSLQKFSGEDLSSTERLKTQREQMRVYIDQQSKENSERKAMEKDTERRYFEQEKALVEEASRIESELERRRKAELSERKEFNQHQVEEKKYKDRTARIVDTEQSLAEIETTLTSDLMTENPAQATHSWNPKKVVTYHYKGMSPTEIDEVLREQERQRLEKQAQKAKEAEEQRTWEQLQEALRREAILKEREKQRLQKAQMAQQQQEFIRQAQEKQQRQDYVNRVMHVNEITDEFYSQFGRSSR